MRLSLLLLLLLLPMEQTPLLGGNDDPTVPKGAVQVVRTVAGSGVQRYRCSGSAWMLVGPEAKLTDLDTHEELGRHSAGPTWTWVDGSAVKGHVVATVASPEAGSLPWLLLAAEPVPGRRGVLSEVTMIRRWQTHGGVAPATGCDAAHSGTTTRVPYTATYVFFSGR